MGTGVSLDIPVAKDQRIFESVFKLLTEIDSRFSPYKESSELSKYQRGEIAHKDLNAEMKHVLKESKKFEKLTNGYFSANYSGKFDPTGYVKGWAIAEAGKLLKKNGYQTFCMSIGGDVLASSDGDKEWSIGIQNPSVNKYLTSQVFINSGAVATSGSYERGQHIINPKTGHPATELISVTVVGPDIIKADVLATAAFAMGRAAIDFINHQKNYEGLAIDRNGVTFLSSGISKVLNRNPGSNQL